MIQLPEKVEGPSRSGGLWEGWRRWSDLLVNVLNVQLTLFSLAPQANVTLLWLSKGS